MKHLMYGSHILRRCFVISYQIVDWSSSAECSFITISASEPVKAKNLTVRTNIVTSLIVLRFNIE